MKRMLMIIACVLCMFFTVDAKRNVLLIGIGHYPPKSGWRTISSDNDIRLLSSKVFKSFNVSTLIDKDATHANILRALNKLIAESNKSDTIFIHFSCHGQQILTNDKNEPDFLDEALVPYDAFSTESKSYFGQNHLTDNELGLLINRLREKCGKKGLVIITIDACFSDSMNKGEKKDNGVIYRGGAEIFGANTISKDSLYAIQRRRMLTDDDLIEKLPDGANAIIISACKTYQRNMEVVKDKTGYGSLSYAMYASAKHNGIDNLFKWFDGIYRQMQKDAFTQTPQIRTTLSYKFPIRAENKQVPIAQHEQGLNTHVVFILLLSIVLSLLIICLVIWKLKKKR